MLWYKAWRETRWRFWIGLLLLICSAAGSVLMYPQLMRLVPLGTKLELGGELGRRVAESLDLARDYRGYIWSQWFRQNFSQTFSLFAILLGAGGLMSQATSGAALFTLSLPASRNRLTATRVAVGLAELFVLALVPSLVIPMLSPAIGQRYGLVDALVHAGCLFVAGTTLYSFTFLLSTAFGDVWRPALIAIGAAMAMSLGERFMPELSGYGVFGTMSAEAYFRSGGLPWLGLLVSTLVSTALSYGAAQNIVRRDF